MFNTIEEAKIAYQEALEATQNNQPIPKKRRTLRSTNTSGYNGVKQNKKSKRWIVTYKGHYIGAFDTIEQAAEARKQAEINQKRKIRGSIIQRTR